MKSVKFLLAIFTVGVVLAGCVTTQDSSRENFDEYERTRRIGNRVYVEDPYYGTVVLEKDRYTGRYYDVTSGYRRYSSPYSRYDSYRNYGNYNRYYRNYNNSGSVQQPQKPSSEQIQQNKQEARKKILGN